jgi:hypothetical protein
MHYVRSGIGPSLLKEPALTSGASAPTRGLRIVGDECSGSSGTGVGPLRKIHVTVR